MNKIKELLRLKKTWTLIGALLGVLGYSQYVPVADAIGEAIPLTNQQDKTEVTNVVDN